jgi:hypothetical protein
MFYVCTFREPTFLTEKGKRRLFISPCCLCGLVHKCAPGSLGDWMQPQCSIVNLLWSIIIIIIINNNNNNNTADVHSNMLGASLLPITAGPSNYVYTNCLHFRFHASK